MRICIYLENYIAGGVDSVIVNKINNWPDSKDNIILVCNHSHDGLEKILRKNIRRNYILVLSPVKTLRDIYDKYLPNQRIFQIAFKLFWNYSRYGLLIYNVRKLYNLFKQLYPDVIFIHNGGYPGADTARAAVISAKHAGVRNIFMVIHNLAHRSRVSRLPFEIAIDRTVDRNSKIICVSNKAVEILLMNRNIKQDISVIHNGVENIEKLSDDEIKEFRRAYGLPPTSKIIGMVTSYEKRKGHEDLFSALNILKRNKDLENWKCLIFGKGSLYDEKRIRHAITKYRVDDKVILCGFKSNVPRHYRAFSVCVLPSQEYESFPMSILEAMAAEVPVVATDVGGVREMVIDGVTGFIVPPCKPEILGDKLRQLLNDNMVLSRMGQGAKRHFEANFTATKMAKNYYQLVH